MREIKFRAWDKELSCMKYKLFLCATGDDECELNEMLGVKYLEFMQYTGLKDKNGKEIYEGDIVRDSYYSCYKEYGVVKFGNQDIGHDFSSIGFFVESERDPIGNLCSNVEVMGNIYENSDLLNNK